MESYMPDSESCEQYIRCPFDWSCPSGPDPVTGEGCEGQASAVAIGLAVAFLCCVCLVFRFARRMKSAPMKGIVGIRLPGFGRTNIQWTREDGVTDRDGTKKGRLRYKLDHQTIALFSKSDWRMQGCATLTPQGGSGDTIGPVDLDFSGTVNFVLQMRVTTEAKDSLLVGKVCRQGDAALKSGGAKALMIKQGLLAWQVGGGCISGTTYIADGEQHDISVSYSAAADQYVLWVDGSEEARGLNAVGDDPDTCLVLGRPFAPRDDEFNSFYPLFEELRNNGVEVFPLEERAEEPLFDGDIEGLTWNEYQWNQDAGCMAWFAYDLRIDTEEAVREMMAKRETEHHETAFDAQSVTGTSHQLFHKGQTVEYWSKTVQSWLPAKVIDVKDRHYDATLEFDTFSYDVYVGAAEQTVLGVDMMNLRVPFVQGEAVSVFSQKHGSWFPANIHKSRYDADPRLGYDITLEQVFDAGLGKTVPTKLQQDLQRYTAAQGPGESLATQGTSRQGETPPPVALKNMPAKRLRRRYVEGKRVRLYRGVDEGFVDAEVVREQADEAPVLDEVVVPSPARSERSPSPQGRAGSNDEGAQRRVRRYNIGEQRHATVVVRRLDGGLPQEMPVPEYVLRGDVASSMEELPTEVNIIASNAPEGLVV
jgi:hypothetical protein